MSQSRVWKFSSLKPYNLTWWAFKLKLYFNLNVNVTNFYIMQISFSLAYYQNILMLSEFLNVYKNLLIHPDSSLLVTKLFGNRTKLPQGGKSWIWFANLLSIVSFASSTTKKENREISWKNLHEKIFLDEKKPAKKCCLINFQRLIWYLGRTE